MNIDERAARFATTSKRFFESLLSVPIGTLPAGTRFRDVDGREWTVRRKLPSGTVIAAHADGTTTWFAGDAYAYPLPKGEK